MPLKLDAIAEAIHAMASTFDGADQRDRLQLALDRLRATDPAHVRRRLDDPQAHPAWVVAYPERSLAATYPLPPLPADFAVLGADGSMIEPDRHNPLRFFVINTGYALLTYGSQPAAEMDAVSQLYYQTDEIFISPDHRTLPIEGALLALKMAVEEMNVLVKAATAITQPQALALRDGTLILWGLDSPGIADDVRQRFLQPYQDALRTLQEMGVPIAAYTSYPNADDVVNALRVGLCRDPSVVCRRCEAIFQRVLPETPICAPLATLVDRFLFSRHLAEGERSDCFRSRQDVLKFYDADQAIYFFYLHTGSEIARVEMPAWVARDPVLLDRVHALVYDQCQRGRGYPPALTEAHEQAVITVGDREVVEELVARALADRAVVYLRSQKDQSKRVRGV